MPALVAGTHVLVPYSAPNLRFIPAQAGIQGPQPAALGPRFRGDERT